MLGLSIFEHVFYEFNKADITVDSLLTLSDLICKLHIVCVDFDDVEKLRTFCILLKSHWIFRIMSSTANKVDQSNEIDLKHVDMFLLNEINFIEHHLDELEKYFFNNENVKEIICLYRRHIAFIKKPIANGVYEIWNSYLQTFSNEILNFKDILLDLSPSFLHQLSRCMKGWPISTPNEVSQESENISFKKLKSVLGVLSNSKDGLLDVHKLIRSSKVESIITKFTALREIGPYGVQNEFVSEIKRNFGQYYTLQWLYRESMSLSKCVISENHFEDSDLFSSEDHVNQDESESQGIVLKENIINSNVVPELETNPPRYNSNGTTDANDNIFEVTNVSKSPRNNVENMRYSTNARTSKLNNDDKNSEEFIDIIPKTKCKEGRKRKVYDTINTSIHTRSTTVHKNVEERNPKCQRKKASRENEKISKVRKKEASIISKRNSLDNINDNISEDQCISRRTRSSDFSEINVKESPLFTNNSTMIKVKKNLRRRRLLQIDAAPVDLDFTEEFDIPKSMVRKPNIIRDRVKNPHKNIIIQTNNNAEMCIEKKSAQKMVMQQNINGSDAIIKGRRIKWSLEETYLVYKGVLKKMTWSTIKSAYFRNSIRTNMHIKDRWRIVHTNTNLMNTLREMNLNDTDV